MSKNFNNIILENKEFCLTIGSDCIAESLIHKATGTECLLQGEEIPLFSLTEERPFNNEIKLAHPNKRTIFQANRVRLEESKLIVGFELVGFEAIVDVKVTDTYMAFELEDFIIYPENFGRLKLTPPPVYEFRVLQLPVKNRSRFGEWLNVSWDDTVAVNVLATCPYTRIDTERRKDCRIMYGDALRDVRLKHCGAALIVAAPDKLMDAIEQVEIDYNLPRGVESRRSKAINASAYWAYDINPSNVDEHIAYAKQGGFRMMLIYYQAIFVEGDWWCYNGNYDFREEYPRGLEDVKEMLTRIKAAGITPGLHFLQTHIGGKSRYVTPVADHRLHLTRYFTLAKPLGTEDETIYVEQNPLGTVMESLCRVLKFDGELISYEGYTTEYPYCFTGCKRGHFETNITPHNRGTIGGILDLSEFHASSIYLDQNSSLQDEIADKLAATYNAGFEFAYFDGSEGTNAPFEIYIPLAQYRVYKKFDKAPLYCEGAAKAHFSWHMLSGGNAFDIFKPPVFKEKIIEFPFEEAPRMAEDFTRLNFGWWSYYQETQPDQYEFGTSRAAAWDCPITMQAHREILVSNPRTKDNLEVMRRWEDVRADGLLTEEMKAQLKNPKQEHIMLINEEGEYELAAYDRITGAASGNKLVTAYVFERKGKSYVVCWHNEGEGILRLPLATTQITYEEEIGGEKARIVADGNSVNLAIAGRRYISSSLPKEVLVKAVEKAELLTMTDVSRI